MCLMPTTPRRLEMKTRLAMFLVVLSFAFAMEGRSEIQPVFVPIGSASYTVPANKVFVVEVVTCAEAGVLDMLLSPVAFQYFQTPGSTVSLARPLKVPGGTLIGRHDAGVGTWYLAGLLVDPSDLYAAVTSEFESLYASAGDLGGRLRLGSPRPATVKIEKTPNLASPEWTQELSALIERRSGAEHSFTLPAPTDQQQFYRAKARARE